MGTKLKHRLVRLERYGSLSTNFAALISTLKFDEPVIFGSPKYFEYASNGSERIPVPVLRPDAPIPERPIL